MSAGDYIPGDVLGKYRVLEVIGRGSNGVTYKVWHRRGMLSNKQHTLCILTHAKISMVFTLL